MLYEIYEYLIYAVNKMLLLRGSYWFYREAIYRRSNCSACTPLSNKALNESTVP